MCDWRKIIRRARARAQYNGEAENKENEMRAAFGNNIKMQTFEEKYGEYFMQHSSCRQVVFNSTHHMH